MKRHYYALFTDYLCRDSQPSPADVLVRFDTRDERAHWCETVNASHRYTGEFVPVNLKDVPRSFRISDFDDANKRRETNEPRTFLDKPVPYILPR